MIVLIDMDDVVADTSSYLYQILREKHPNIPKFQIPRTHFDIKDEYSPENLGLVQEALYSPSFQLSIPPVPGSLKAILEICKLGHSVHFCSTPHAVYETSVLQKYQWLEKKLGRSFARRLILIDDKTLIFGDLLIDDKPKVEGSRVPEWEHVLFGRTSYNQHIQGKRRLNSWDEWKNVLTEL